MTYRLIIRPEAEAELADAFEWYERHAAGLGDDFLLAIDRVVDSIVGNPFQYPVLYRNLRRALIRRFPYQVLFLVGSDTISVIAVFHGARDPRRWQHRC